MKTKVELKQMLNLKLEKGEDASDLIEQLANYPNSNIIRTNVVYSDQEKQAIMLFNKDKRFKETE